MVKVVINGSSDFHIAILFSYCDIHLSDTDKRKRKNIGFYALVGLDGSRSEFAVIVRNGQVYV